MTAGGIPTQLKISSSPEELLLSGGGTSTGLTRTLELNPEIPEGVLHITARAAACDGEPGGEIPDARSLPPVPAGLGHPGAP